MSDEVKSIVTEYDQLKSKLQLKIRSLENKCHSQNKTAHTMHQISQEYGNHHYLCHPNCHSKNTQNTTFLMNCNENQASSNQTTPQQLPVNNSQMTDAYFKMNLQLQREMNQNLQTLSQRILNLSQKKQESSVFQYDQNDHIGRRISKKSQKRQNIGSSQFDRNNSRVKSLCSHQSIKQNFYRNTGNHNLKTSNNSKSMKTHSYNKYKNTSQGKRIIKKHIQQFDTQYFARFKASQKRKRRCPEHQANKMKNKYIAISKSKEIFKDSVHRHKKHEKDHLTNSFNKQQKDRKQVLEIAKNFFSNYGGAMK